ncbi:hypothetical protein [Salinibacter ruber]|jgi:hypothetical protein|uniref:Uncharacterized protein n=1 Tax=Salinibacter ruber TaxID=146919 RepID=A0AAW5PBP1_9BACT|nr:hypothetical protein [Salinibacter ruber]MCS4159437.1 hypothetical protein [Salinibacter ruber]MCS4223688.1 hypothetical protein [Salinibacter ruber]
MDIEIEGLDELENYFEQLEEKAKELEGENKVPFSELFDTSFMSEHTPHTDFVAFLEAGGFEVETQEDFEAIPEAELNEHIRETTELESWEEMQAAATEAWVAEQMDLG